MKKLIIICLAAALTGCAGLHTEGKLVFTYKTPTEEKAK